MVVYKRKPVRILTLKNDPDDDALVWQINETGEVFHTYEDYLERMDFYNTKQFSCEISGRSGLTFFEALKSEAAGAQEVEQTFPEALKGPVLRKVQFKTTSRLDNLVDMIFDEFRQDFFPGETVVMLQPSGDRPHGVVRDKVTNSRDGEPYSRYMVSVEEPTAADHFCEAQQLSRDRKSFNKSVLRSFIKKTVTRDAWNGAPWLVRHNYANKYHIDTRVPLELSYDTKLQERRALQAQKRASSAHDDLGISNGGGGVSSGTPPSFGAGGPARLPDLKPEGKSHHHHHHHVLHHKTTQGGLSSNGTAASKENGKTANGQYVPVPGQFMHLPLPGNPFQTQMSIRNSQKGGPALIPPPPEPAPPPPPPPPPKYPIEDLQVPQKKSGTITRPRLGFLCRDAPVADADADADADVNADADTPPYRAAIEMRSVGPLLETWDTLNVYCEIFKLDSFTFDDYVEAMCVASDEVDIELFDEIHCSVLKTIVDDQGRLQVALPALAESESESESEPEPEPEPEPTPEAKPLRATRSSMAKQEAERLAAEVAAADAEASIVHRADEALRGYDWLAEATKRAFEGGGWQMMMVGLLHRLSRDGRRRAACDEVLARLVPAADADPTPGTVRARYGRLDVNLRVQALQMLCMLTYETKAFRAYMEECSEGMTTYRKERIEWQRQRKQAYEDLKPLWDQKRALDAEINPQGENNSATPKADDSFAADVDVKMVDPDETVDDDAADPDRTEDEDDEEGAATSAAARRSLRRQQDKSTERARREKEEQRQRRERERAEGVPPGANPKQARLYSKVLKDMAKCREIVKKCEDEMAVIENDLRENDCPRTRVLGKDRFWNRYYWFERNGMPIGGLPTSSTAYAGYANGCIWVQGPDEIEREGFIDVPGVMQAEYRARLGVTIPERKRHEEGGTSVATARQWGFFSEPDQVEALISWLDTRGVNENKLKKELVLYKERILTTMRNRRAYLDEGKEEEEHSEEQQQQQLNNSNNGNLNGSGVSKRTRTRGVAVAVAAAAAAAAAASPEPQERQYRCRKWTNLTAVDECGHLHSQQPAPARSRKKGRKREAVAEAEPSPARKTRRR